MSQALALAVLAGIVSGGLGLAPISGSLLMVLLGYFVQLPMMLAGLTLGLAGALIAALTATALNALIAGLLPALIFLAAFAFPSVFLVRQALLSRQDQGGLVWYPPGLILAQLAAIAVAGLLFAFFLFSGQPGGLLGAIESMLAEAARRLSEAAGRPASELSGLTARASIVPAALACSWLIMTAANGAVAQAIAARSGWNRRPSPELASLELPFWLWPMMGAAALLAIVGPADLSLFARSALVVLIAPFGFQGLAVIHKFANRWSYRQLGLAAVYAGIIVLTWPILAVVVLGLVEDWAHWRRHM